MFEWSAYLKDPGICKLWVVDCLEECFNDFESMLNLTFTTAAEYHQKKIDKEIIIVARNLYD
jgi:hypothetical protein